MSRLLLTSGEEASVEIIPRQEAISILSKPTYRRDWFGNKYLSPYRNSRGPGPAADHINYGLQVQGKCRAVIRIGKAPWGNRPVVGAIGADLANHCAYLSRLWGAGISSTDLADFIKQANLHFPYDMLVRRPGREVYRYLLSLDSMSGWLIENPQGGIFESPPIAGRIYHTAGALYAGTTKSMTRPTRYVTNDGQIRSLYQDGRTLKAELQQQPGVRLVDDGPKHRFVFILAEEGSLQYAAYRNVLPPWVQAFEWGEGSLGWIQPRLLVRLFGWLSLRLPEIPLFRPGASLRWG